MQFVAPLAEVQECPYYFHACCRWEAGTRVSPCVKGTYGPGLRVVMLRSRSLL